MTRASTGKLVCINEESSVRITRVHTEHAVVDILLCALALVTGGEKTTGRIWEEASFEAGGLGVVVVAVTISLRDVLEDDSPVTFNVDSPADLGVVNVTGAEVALWSYPVAGVIRRRSLASP